MRKSDNVEKPEFVSNNEQVRYIGKGIECQVFEIVKMKLVCKIYDTDADARFNYILQHIAYQHGIGPEPLSLEKNYYFSRYIASYDRMDSYSKLPKKLLPRKEPFYKLKESIEYQEFIAKINDIFGDWGDSHSGNIGIIFVNGKRKFMIIDFGIAGFYNTDIGAKLATKLGIYYK